MAPRAFPHTLEQTLRESGALSTRLRQNGQHFISVLCPAVSLSTMAPTVNIMAARSLSSSCFAELLSSSNLCILDVRPFLQYNQSHVQDAINIPLSPLVLRRAAANGIGSLISEDVRERLARASTVVLYDAETEDVERDSAQKSALKVMLDGLQSVALSVYFLCGGFSSFQSAYPSLCKAATRSGCGPSLRCIPGSAPVGAFSHGHPLQRQLSSNSVLSLGLPSCAAGSCCESPRESPSPAELAPHLLLGSIQHASDREVMSKAGVTAVLNVSNQCKNYFCDDLVYKRIPVDDTINSSLMPYFQEAAEFIESVRIANGRVLVHCVGGVSRSPTVCIAYFVLRGLMTVDEAYKFIRSRRSLVSPNFSFMGELRMLEKELDGRRSQAHTTDCSLPTTATAS